VTDSTNRPAPDDWRRQGQDRYLTGVRLFAREYRPYRPQWEHDHCEFCGAKFSLNEPDLRSGYSTEDGYRWVSNDCFTNFKDEFNWQVSSAWRRNR
jgi:hypothetical protein